MQLMQPLCLFSTDVVLVSSRDVPNIAVAVLPTACCACYRCTFSRKRQLLSGWQPHAAWTTGSC
jgi:hypothetical protein